MKAFSIKNEIAVKWLIYNSYKLGHEWGLFKFKKKKTFIEYQI